MSDVKLKNRIANLEVVVRNLKEDMKELKRQCREADEAIGWGSGVKTYDINIDKEHE